jgi:hypothetical protein
LHVLDLELVDVANEHLANAGFEAIVLYPELVFQPNRACRWTSRCLAIDQTVRSSSIEPQHSVADRLQPYPADPCRVGTRATVIDLGKCQQAPYLLRLARLLRHSPQRRPVEITTQANWSRHGKPPPFAMLNHVTADS